MNIDQIGEDLITQINDGSELAFSELYKAYYVYLNTIAIYYLFDKNVSAEVVDDVFLNIWYKRRTLAFPVHSYLIRAVQNGCLNYIRSQRNDSRKCTSEYDCGDTNEGTCRQNG